MDYDVCIIGAGWAGISAALKAAALSKNVCLLEEKELGGTCLNRGCIPAKAILHYSKEGLGFGDIREKKDQVVQRLRTGVLSQIKAKKIDYRQARARITGPCELTTSQGQDIHSKFILIAAGTEPKDLDSLKFDHKKVLSSDDILNLKDIPKKLLIVGAGALGCEFAQIFKNLGSDVTIIESARQLLPGFDAELSKKLKQAFGKADIEVYLGADVKSFNPDDFDKVLLAVGRSGRFDELWDRSLSIKESDGAVVVDRTLKTDVPSIFAAGDCIGGYKLAHVARYEAELAVNNMFLEVQKRDYSVVPVSVYTTPEVAAAGIGEEEARESGAACQIKTAHFLSNGMAHIFGETQGFLKVIVDVETGCILGVGIIGLEASEIVNIFSILMQNKVTIKELRKTIFAHPSVSEIVAEVARAFDS
jgi:dihydrolipoamide dehydrogenase